MEAQTWFGSSGCDNMCSTCSTRVCLQDGDTASTNPTAKAARSHQISRLDHICILVSLKFYQGRCQDKSRQDLLHSSNSHMAYRSCILEPERRGPRERKVSAGVAHGPPRHLACLTIDEAVH